ncbi:MAG: PilN domain-containing protein [Thermoanaerobaculia bacterium]
MSRPVLNLAAEPFVNRRPVVRLAALLWIAGVVLLAVNAWLFRDFLVGRGDVHARLQEVRESIDVEERQIAALTEELASFDLGSQNAQVQYLNQRIAQRRFSWSRLFDRLAEVLPQDVRLRTLTPSTDADDRSSRTFDQEAPPLARGQVLLSIRGEARGDDDVLELVDALFADTAFEHPNLSRQATTDRDLVEFQLDTVYNAPELPGARTAPAEGTEDGGPEPLGRPASAPPELS